MNIFSNFNIYQYNYNKTASPGFESAKARKLITKIAQSKQLSKEKITFEELESMYNELGYNVLRKRGSHAVITTPNGYNIPLVMPHGHKHVSPLDLKRFILVQQNKFEEAAKA